MEFLKKHWLKIAIVLVIIIVIYMMTNKKKESSYASSSPCPGCGAGVKNCTCRGAGVNMVTAS